MPGAIIIGPASVRGEAAALRLVGLYKIFGDHVAVDHVDLTVVPGSFYGLVGPNGAGKTTALSMAAGCVPTRAVRWCSASTSGATRWPRGS